MKLFFKVIILFMIIFNFKMPYVYNSVVLADLLVFFYYFFVRKSIPATYFYYRYTVIILIGTLVLAGINLAFTVLHGEFYSLMQRRLILEFFMLSSFIFSLPLFIENEEKEAYEKMTLLICYAFALQGLLHLTGYLYKPFGDFLYDLKGPEFKSFMENPSYGLAKFRGYALTGSIFFELPSAYGVACIMFFRLQLIEGQKYLSGFKAYAVFFFLIAGISLSGRTGFIGLFMGLFLYAVYSLDKFSKWVKNAWKIIVGVAFALAFFYLLLPPGKQKALNDEIFPFAFEAYYNWRDKGTFSTGSSDALIHGHYYELRSETLLAGHGIIANPSNNYKPTDAGYMNALVFGGVLYLLCLIIYQYLYFAAPLSINYRRQTKEEKHDFLCFLLLFAYMFILEYKAEAMGTQHITEVLYMAVGSSFLIKYYNQLENG